MKEFFRSGMLFVTYIKKYLHIRILLKGSLMRVKRLISTHGQIVGFWRPMHIIDYFVKF